MGNKHIRLSASKIKSVEQCSFKFYCNYVLKLPEETHPKTYVGTVCHEIFEHLMQPENDELREMVFAAGDMRMFPQLEALSAELVEKYAIKDEFAEPIPEMINLGLSYLEGVLKDPEVKEVYPEYEFTIHHEGYELKGFIDLLVIYEDRALIIDYKSQGRKFTKKDLKTNKQAFAYQIAVFKKFSLPSTVEFIMLRHPPTRRAPEKHIQRCPFPGERFLKNVEEYFAGQQERFDDFTIEEAKSNLLGDEYGFCKRVCQFRDPKKILRVYDEDGETVKCLDPGDTEGILAADEAGHKIESRMYPGCPHFYPSSNG